MAVGSIFLGFRTASPSSAWACPPRIDLLSVPQHRQDVQWVALSVRPARRDLLALFPQVKSTSRSWYVTSIYTYIHAVRGYVSPRHQVAASLLYRPVGGDEFWANPSSYRQVFPYDQDFSATQMFHVKQKTCTSRLCIAHRPQEQSPLAPIHRNSPSFLRNHSSRCYYF